MLGLRPQHMMTGDTRDGGGVDGGLKPLPAPCLTQLSTLVSVTGSQDHARAGGGAVRKLHGMRWLNLSLSLAPGHVQVSDSGWTVRASGGPPPGGRGRRAVSQQLSWGNLALLSLPPASSRWRVTFS